jgi:hypothetical protein
LKFIRLGTKGNRVWVAVELVHAAHSSDHHDIRQTRRRRRRWRKQWRR